MELFGKNPFFTEERRYRILDPSAHLALLNMEEYPIKPSFEKFSFMPIPFKSGYAVINEEEGYNVEYIRRTRELINPNEYSVEFLECTFEIKNKEGDYEKITENRSLLFLKRGENVISIAPIIGCFDHVNKCKLSDIFKKIASSMCVL